MAKSSPTRAIVVHVEAAKRLLRDLEQHAQTAVDALGQESDDAFLAAVDERERILAKLNQVVEALTQERTATGGVPDDNDSETKALFAEMAHAAAAVLRSHDYLTSRARRERDRLATALHRTSTPDAVADQYAAASNSSRTRRLSVTG